MAKIINPLFSVAASGSIGRALTFRDGQRISTARKYSTPTGDPSTTQARLRLTAAHAASSFTAMSELERQKWQASAQRASLPIFALYMREFINQSATLLAPPLPPAGFP